LIDQLQFVCVTAAKSITTVPALGEPIARNNQMPRSTDPYSPPAPNSTHVKPFPVTVGAALVPLAIEASTARINRRPAVGEIDAVVKLVASVVVLAFVRFAAVIAIYGALAVSSYGPASRNPPAVTRVLPAMSVTGTP
jgi:hypothetical protein